MHIIQPSLFDFEVFVKEKNHSRLVGVLEVLPVEKLLMAGAGTLDGTQGVFVTRDVVSSDCRVA